MSVPICSKLFNNDSHAINGQNGEEIVRKFSEESQEMEQDGQKMVQDAGKWSEMIRKCQ